MRKNFLLLLLAAMFTMVSCANNESTKQQQSEEELCINRLMAQCQNFDSQTLVQNLPGEWVIDSAFMYDSEWKDIVETHIFQGVHQLAGLASVTYTFATDGKGLYYSTNVSLGPNEPPYTYDYEWNYDVEGKKLVMSNEDMRIECVVSGFNGTYLILDRTDHVYDSYTDKHTYSYVREILKKRQN